MTVYTRISKTNTRNLKAAQRMSEGLYVLLVYFFDTQTLISQTTMRRPVKVCHGFGPELNS